MILQGEKAFGALRELTGGRSEAEWRAPDVPAIERLRSAWSTPGRAPLELAILVRQALQFEAGRREGIAPNVPITADGPMRGFAEWASIGLKSEPLGSGQLISAAPWRPAWGVAIPPDGLEAYAAAERPKPLAAELSCAGDPFLAALGHGTYQSVGQRAAVRAALTTPPGGALAVSLATGEGKSLIFQLAARIGFAGDDIPSGGVVVVAVPTVALAIDHENASLLKGFEGPIAYRGGDDASNSALMARLEADRQPLCVASPEAICGPLRRSLGELAARGRLRALVLDEAHLVDGWGTGFRTKFQSLSGVRQEWIKRAPTGCAPRTLLLSATLTESSLATLATLFSGPGPFERLSALRLRGEPDYWTVGCADESERIERVLEALRHLPRPAILYVTQIDQAERWRLQLKEVGYRTVEMVHGRTPNRERERVLLGWRQGEVDLVVATSAFGLGIDFPHVRAVIHACIPESLDRFYQEVGRSGRDGRSCLSLVLHTSGDLGVAQSISRALVISVQRGLRRWTSMYERRTSGEVRDSHVLPLDVAPSHEPEDIDMQGERNSDWNARVLALMARAGLIRLLGEPENAPAAGPHEQVLILDHGHLQSATWTRHVEPLRRELARASDRSLELMRRNLSVATCPAPSFLSLYDAGPEAHACSRCASCRADPMARRPEQPRLEPSPPWPAPRPLGGRLGRLLGADRRLVVWYDPEGVDRRFRRRFGELLPAARLEGVTNVAFVGEAVVLVQEASAVGQNIPLFMTQVGRLPQRRLPSGGELVVFGQLAQLEGLDLAPPRQPDSQILMLPLDLPDPYRPGLPLRSAYGGRSLTFDAFFESLCR